MASHAFIHGQCRHDARFCLFWGLVTGFGTIFGVIGGFASASIVGVAVYLLTSQASLLAPLVILLPVATVGVVIGASVGILQSFVLPWSREARGRWIVRSVIGWGIGAAIGATAAVAYELQAGGSSATLVEGSNRKLILLMTPILGLALGLSLWSALPSWRPSMPLWLAAHVAASSLGWLAAWPLAGASSMTLGLTWQGVILGPLVFTAITSMLMTWIGRRRLAAPTRASEERKA